MKKFMFLNAMFCISIFSNGRLFAQQKDTIKCVLLLSDTSANSDHSSWWVNAYEVREKHNTSEGQIDAGICPNCWEDYWKHLCYIDKYKMTIPKKYCIWIAK